MKTKNQYMRTRNIFIISFSLLLVAVSSAISHAQTRYLNEDEDYPKIESLKWLNEDFLARQRTLINEVTRDKYAKPFRNDTRDIALLQRLIDDEIIPIDEKKMLQAMGVILGDLYVKNNKYLDWQVYKEKDIWSHAVCAKGTKDCLFPITMLSRRIELGVKPNVANVYSKGKKLIENSVPAYSFRN